MLDAVRRIHTEAGFELRGLLSNSEKVLQTLGEDYTQSVNAIQKSMDNCSPNDKILGLSWNIQEDYFTFDLSLNKADRTIVEGLRYRTKREYLPS